MTTVYLIASGDLRLSANQVCWPAQEAMEKQIVEAVKREGATIKRGHPYDPVKKHGFIDSQKYGMEVFRSIPEDAPVIVAEAVWQYTHHVLPGLSTHKGPILTVANWSGEWPGLVGMLNLNGSLTKAGVKYGTLWSEDFTDEFFKKGLRTWLQKGKVTHKTPQVHPYDAATAPATAVRVGVKVAQDLRKNKAIMGIFDEGCMGMYNALISDEMLMSTGVYKERLSQSALYYKATTVSEDEARGVYRWLLDKGLKFKLGADEATELTEQQVLGQCRMYIAAVRIAGEFGCSVVGIQYQQGLKDLAPASDLVEGLLNNVDRPPVMDEQGHELFPGEAIPNFNEVDECAGLDGLVTYRLWRKLGLPPENTLHDVRWGRQYNGPSNGKKLNDFVWVFEISGAAPAAHFIGGYAGAVSERQPAMYFPRGGGSLKGISKPGWVVWSRVFVADGRLNCDIGLAESVQLPLEETEERWRLTTPEWPIMHAVLKGISRDEFMARHKANHIQVAYANDKASARKALYAKAAAMNELGMQVAICGDV
ncbi:MAG: fucose isomerase [Chloroflexi bacterium]|nr:fucose isomerase [Chloroflexota bacterium]MCL5275491.1 fucose isomerase [Chloroflexota bacterium]